MRKIIIICLLLSTIAGIHAQNVPAPMIPARLVNDFASIIEPSAKQQMEDSLVAFDRATSTQIAVVTIEDLDGYAPADYALAILRKWGVGRQGKNNGIVVLVKPRNDYGGGSVYISVGTGLEGVLNDAKAGRIIDNFMLDDLRNGDYTSALINGTAALRSVVRGEFTIDGYEDEELEGGEIALCIVIIIIFLVILLIVISKSGNGDDSSFGGGGTIIPPFWGTGSHRGGGFSGGGFSGGFGGFGGGFGAGGGAGRSF